MPLFIEPVEWYWENVAGGNAEEDLPWLRSGRRRRSDVPAKTRRRRVVKKTVTENASGDHSDSDEVEEMITNHVEEWEEVEETGSSSKILSI